MMCYVLANIAYVAVLPLDAIADFANQQTVQGFATTFAHKAMGLTGQIIVPVLIAISAFGALNGAAFSGLVGASHMGGCVYMPKVLECSISAQSAVISPRSLHGCMARKRQSR